MPNRILKESVRCSAQIDSISWFAEVVFYRLIVTVDDYGCADGRAVWLRSQMFQTREDVSAETIKSAIDELEKAGLLRKYEVSGKPFLCLPSWEKHQRIRTKRRKFPPPPGDSLTSCGNLPQSAADCQSESVSKPIQSEFRSESQAESASVSQSSIPLIYRGTDIDLAIREAGLPNDQNADFWKKCASKSPERLTSAIGQAALKTPNHPITWSDVAKEYREVRP